jgi:membrane associated rhomboid family serine protease
MKSKGPIGLYFVVGILGVVAGVANFFQKHYVFAAVYGLFGCIWLLMAMLKSRAEDASPASGAHDAAGRSSPAPPALPAERTPKPSQS